MALMMLVMVGCAEVGGGGQTSAMVRDGSPTASTVADWDDADAAVLVSVEHVRAVVTRTEVISNTQRRYLLHRTNGERGVLELRRSSPDTSDPTPISMTCSFGRLGDPEHEQRLMRAVGDRLERLRGVDFAPRK